MNASSARHQYPLKIPAVFIVLYILIYTYKDEYSVKYLVFLLIFNDQWLICDLFGVDLQFNEVQTRFGQNILACLSLKLARDSYNKNTIVIDSNAALLKDITINKNHSLFIILM